MQWYIDWVIAYPFLSAAIQFGILGTFGELLSYCLRAHVIALPCSRIQLAAKILSWAVLGIVIKIGFVGMRGFVAALDEHNLLLPGCDSGLGLAFAMSVNTNLFFGPQMMFIHRIEDNIIAGKWSTAGLTKAWWTLLWFWIPAHTITFWLPKEYQIGLAAVWSVALGVIMGFAAPKKSAS